MAYFTRYSSIPSKPEQIRRAKGYVTLTEKLHGCCFGIEYDLKTGKYRAFSRNRVLNEGDEFHGWELIFEAHKEMVRDIAVNINMFTCPIKKIAVFGELVGPTILNGGHYADKTTFYAFDLRVHLNEEQYFWMGWTDFVMTVENVGMARVPVYTTGTADQAIEYAKHNVETERSLVSDGGPFEGYVLHPHEISHGGRRMIMKVKTKAFTEVKKGNKKNKIEVTEECKRILSEMDGVEGMDDKIQMNYRIGKWARGRATELGWSMKNRKILSAEITKNFFAFHLTRMEDKWTSVRYECAQSKELESVDPDTILRATALDVVQEYCEENGYKFDSDCTAVLVNRLMDLQLV